MEGTMFEQPAASPGIMSALESGRSTTTGQVSSGGLARGERRGKKRKAYTARACEDCKRRKVKCSGDDICHHCNARRVPCIYTSNPLTTSRVERCANTTLDAPPTITAPREPSQSRTEAASPVAANQSDSTSGKDAELGDRVRALERMLNHVVEFAKIPPRYDDDVVHSPPPAFQPRIRIPLVDEDKEEDMFAPRDSGPDDLSLSSQVAAMSALLSHPASPKPSPGQQSSKSQVVVELPDPPTLQHLLDVYFRDFECYFPFLDREDTESRIYSVIRRLGYSSYNSMLLVSRPDLPLIALACVMLAMAECLDSAEGACDAELRSGWSIYLQGYRAVQRLAYSRDFNLDVVRAQSLIAAYLMHAELLRAASQAMSVAFQLAAALKLNDQRTWTEVSPKEITSRQQLWWCIYFLDRRIAQKGGLTYHIRDPEFRVDDFKLEREQHHPREDMQSGSSITETRNYLQALINLARLWGQIWDTFFAAGAKKKGDWLEVEIMDTQILNARRQLSDELTWNADRMIDYALMGQHEPALRRRVSISTRLDLMRMLIRQNPLKQSVFDPETSHLCARIAREVIHTHDLFTARYPEARASGYFATSSMVECVYHLVPVLHYSTDVEEHRASVIALKRARKILTHLSTKLNVSKKALRALSGVMSRWETENDDHEVLSKDVATPAAERINCGARDISITGVAPYGQSGPADSTLHEGGQIDPAMMSHRYDLEGVYGHVGAESGPQEWSNIPVETLFGTDFEFPSDF